MMCAKCYINGGFEVVHVDVFVVFTHGRDNFLHRGIVDKYPVIGGDVFIHDVGVIYVFVRIGHEFGRGDCKVWCSDSSRREMPDT